LRAIEQTKAPESLAKSVAVCFQPCVKFLASLAKQSRGRRIRREIFHFVRIRQQVVKLVGSTTVEDVFEMLPPQCALAVLDEV
jgi:hypothetical protein